MKNLSIFYLTSVVFVSATTFAFAASTGTSSSGSSSSSSSSSGSGGTISTAPAKKSAKKLSCKRPQVVITVKGVKKCGLKQKVGLISDTELYEQAVALAKDGEYDWALDVFAELQDQNKPEVLNYMGYSHRKAGRLDTAIGFYRKALSINPNFALAREYLGEGYAAAGFIELANVELTEIAKRCGTHCTEYQELQKAITSSVN